MLNVVNLLLQIGSIIGLIGLIITFYRFIKQRKNIFIKGVTFCLIILCIVIIIVSGISLIAGSISLSTTPAGATVYVDDRYIGESPVYVENVLVGTHSIRVEKPGYNTAYQKAHVDIQERVAIDIPMTKQTGSLQISANVDGAAIYIDNTLAGYTPLSTPLTITTGNHELMVSKENYIDSKQTVTINAGDSKTVAATLEPLKSSLTISTMPSGATVYIDGVKKGTTPFALNTLTLGQHLLELKLDGYETKTDFISLATQNGISRSYTLEPTTGSISVTSNPPGLEISIDDESAGISPLTIDNLIPGRYKVSAKTTAYSDNPILNSLLRAISESQAGEYEKTVTVEAGKTTDVFLGVSVTIPENSSYQSMNQTGNITA